ncbi:MAG: DUF1553 domain-containing protein [Fuerstiella sp.]
MKNDRTMLLSNGRGQRVGSGLTTVPCGQVSGRSFPARTVRLILISAWLVVSQSSPGADDGVPDFKTKIAPIFQQHCVRCHSPNVAEGDLSLATISDLVEMGYIVAGDPDSSHLVDVISASEGDIPRMPQESPPLSASQVSLIRQWIKEGATWPQNVVVREKSKADASWWSLQPLQPVVSVSSQTVSSQTRSNQTRGNQTRGNQADGKERSPTAAGTELTIDDFIRARLAEHGLSMSAPADRRTLIRRLTFDLHGLPPSPEAVQSFVDDPDPRAYERLIDRLLESPHYGERFARHWLDIAHYADTHGFERDQRRDHAWRYRDYVIQSLNDDKPYDRFLQEQIAGDVMWPDDDQAVIATGFLAAGPWDYVGQVETKSDILRRSARSLDLDDMATQVMTATMGITIHCARCHDHKLDPVSQKEYYQLRAVFAGLRRQERVTSAAAVQKYEDEKAARTARLRELDFAIARIEGTGSDLADIVGGGNGLGTGTYRQGIDARTAKVQTRDFGALGNVITNRFAASDFGFVDGVFIPDGQDGDAEITISTTGLTVSGLPKTSGMAWDMIRNGPVASQHSPELDGIDFTGDGHSLLGLHANAGITFDLAAFRTAAGGGDLRFTSKLGYFGASGSFHADVWVFVDGEQVMAFRQLQRDDGLQDVQVELSSQARFLTLMATDGGNGYSHDQVGFGDPQLKPVSVRQQSPQDQQRLTQLRRERLTAAEHLADLGPPPRFYGVVADEEPPEVRLLVRGDSEAATGEPLAPAALSSLTMLDPKLGDVHASDADRRAALAAWITDPDNALTRRVIVNRLWQWHFGQGIVSTPSDFGFGGGRPSHPQLLDWLAAELQKRNGSLKQLHRLILTSDAWRQQSQFSADAAGAAVDADNRLLWRQHARRMEAEAIRDAVLSVSGCLNLERGGPGFEDFEYQDAYAPIYTYITADEPALWRRSIYRYIVRTTPDRFLTTLDCPDPANLTPQRLTTTTPLQSLALFNNDFMLRQSQYFADRVRKESGQRPADQVQRAFELALGRKPSSEEALPAADLVRQHGLFVLCRSLFNANEFVYVD